LPPDAGISAFISATATQNRLGFVHEAPPSGRHREVVDQLRGRILDLPLQQAVQILLRDRRLPYVATEAA
jgi:hypothetical protein